MFESLRAASPPSVPRLGQRFLRRPPAPVRLLAPLLFVLGLGFGACWLLPDGAPVAQLGTTLRGVLGPAGWLVPLWMLVLAVRLDRWGRRPHCPIAGRRLLGTATLSLALLLASAVPPALPLGLVVLGSGLLLSGRPWRRLRAGFMHISRGLATAACWLGRLLRVVVRVLLDPFLVPPIAPAAPAAPSCQTRAGRLRRGLRARSRPSTRPQPGARTQVRTQEPS